MRVKLEHYIPHHTFVVFISESLLPSLPDNDLEWIGHVLPEHKSMVQLSRPLNHTMASRRLSSTRNEFWNHQQATLPAFQLEYLIRFVDGERDASVASWSLCKGWQMVTHGSAHVGTLSYQTPQILVDFACAKQMIQSIKADERVLNLELKLPMTTTNAIASQIIQNGPQDLYKANAEQVVRNSIWEQGVTGQDEVVAIGDTGIDHDMFVYNFTILHIGAISATQQLPHLSILSITSIAKLLPISP